MGKVTAYAMGFIDGDNVSFIGWNNDLDYFDVVTTNCLSEDGEEIGIDDEIIEVYICDTINDIQLEIDSAQSEFDDDIQIIPLINEDGYWYPDLY